MKVVFTTDAVHVRDRLDYWQDEATKAYVEHEFGTSAGRSFQGTIRAASMGTLNLSLFECDACLVQRTQRCLKSAADDDVLLCVQVGGSITLHQDGRDMVKKAEDIFILDPRRPFTLDCSPDTRSLVVKTPRWEVQARLGEISALTAHPIARDSAVAPLASGFLTMLAARTDAIDAVTGGKLAQQALDLVALALEEEMRSEPAVLSSARSTTLLRLKANIEAKIRDPALRPALAAAATGISVRYANALLAEEGTSLERFIMARRLHRCRQALADPAQASRTVTDIAYSCGFSDVSHFTRRFKAQFGHSPSECRPQRR